MRFATLVNLAFNTAGLLIVLVCLCAWLLLRPRARAPRLVLAAVVGWYAVISIYPVPYTIGRWWSGGYGSLAKADVPPGRVAIALFGSGAFTAVDWEDGRVAAPDPIGLERTLEAARVYRLIKPAWVISSGAPVDSRSLEVSPGEAMKETLVRLGVPAAKIIVNDRAFDTHDEAHNIARLVPKLELDHVVLVTSQLHMSRALATLRAAGVPAIPAAPRDDPSRRLRWRTAYLPSERGLYEASLAAHEMVGSLYYRLRGWR